MSRPNDEPDNDDCATCGGARVTIGDRIDQRTGEREDDVQRCPDCNGEEHEPEHDDRDEVEYQMRCARDLMERHDEALARLAAYDRGEA